MTWWRRHGKASNDKPVEPSPEAIKERASALAGIERERARRRITDDWIRALRGEMKANHFSERLAELYEGRSAQHDRNAMG